MLAPRSSSQKAHEANSARYSDGPAANAMIWYPSGSKTSNNEYLEQTMFMISYIETQSPRCIGTWTLREHDVLCCATWGCATKGGCRVPRPQCSVTYPSKRPPVTYPLSRSSDSLASHVLKLQTQNLCSHSETVLDGSAGGHAGLQSYPNAKQRWRYEQACTWTSKRAQHNGPISQNKGYGHNGVHYFGHFGGPGSKVCRRGSTTPNARVDQLLQCVDAHRGGGSCRETAV